MSTSLALADMTTLDILSATEEFLADCHLRRLSSTTLQWYKFTLEPFAHFASADSVVQVTGISEQTVRTFLKAQSCRVGARRVNHYREAISRLFKWLIVEGYVTTNPAQNIRKVREPKKLVASFNEAEVKALLAQPDQHSFIGLRDYTFMLLLLDSGLRLSEALGLTVRDLDLATGTLRVLGKGNKERLVGFSRTMERHLRRYLLRRETALQRAERQNCLWVFPNQDAGKWAAKGVHMRLKRYAQQAGVSRVRVSPHTFRHTFALWFVRNGGSPFHLQKILGHASLDMSRRYCELADIDFISCQQELSPLAMGSLAGADSKRVR